MSNRKRAAGETFAEEWLIDATGKPSNNPQVLFDQPPGTLLPVGGLSHGHKGYGMALLVETLTAGLAGFGRADPPEGWGATVHITLHDLHAFGGKRSLPAPDGPRGGPVPEQHAHRPCEAGAAAG
jgi:hypothetical protein